MKGRYYEPCKSRLDQVRWYAQLMEMREGPTPSGEKWVHHGRPEGYVADAAVVAVAADAVAAAAAAAAAVPLATVGACTSPIAAPAFFFFLLLSINQSIYFHYVVKHDFESELNTI